MEWIRLIEESKGHVDFDRALSWGGDIARATDDLSRMYLGNPDARGSLAHALTLLGQDARVQELRRACNVRVRVKVQGDRLFVYLSHATGEQVARFRELMGDRLLPGMKISREHREDLWRALRDAFHGGHVNDVPV